MAFGQSVQVGEGNTGFFNTACLRRVERMCDRKEEGRLEEYFIAFRYALFFVISGIRKDERKELLEDFRQLEEEVNRIEATKEWSDQTKRARVNSLRYDFADKHEYFIFNAFSKVGITTVSDEAVIDFTDKDTRWLSGLVRSAASGPSRIKDREEYMTQVLNKEAGEGVVQDGKEEPRVRRITREDLERLKGKESVAEDEPGSKPEGDVKRDEVSSEDGGAVPSGAGVNPSLSPNSVVPPVPSVPEGPPAEPVEKEDVGEGEESSGAVEKVKKLFARGAYGAGGVYW